MKELKAKEEKKEKGYKIIEINPKKHKPHRAYKIICECGKELIKFVVYYQTREYDVNITYLLDVTCPSCGARFKEIPLS